MLSADGLRSRLPIRGMGVRLDFHLAIGSTNDRASELAGQGALEGTLVVAEEQVAGRGRNGSSWLTPAGSALALSVVLRPEGLAPRAVGGLNAIGALAVVEALEAEGVAAQIKWPNDVLVTGRKTAGVLVEGSWEGARLEFVVLGIGVNVRPASVPPEGQAAFPATCVEAAAGHSVDREKLLLAVVDGVGRWYPRLGARELTAAWERRLAFMGEEVSVSDPRQGGVRRGIVRGLAGDGSLRLLMETGLEVLVGVEATHLRPVKSGNW